MENPNWSLQVDLSNVTPATVPGQKDPIGIHKCITKAVVENNNEKRGTKSLKFECLIEEGPHKGMTIKPNVGLDFAKEFNKQKFAGALLSHGYKPEQIARAGLAVGPATFTGRPCYVGVRFDGSIDEKYGPNLDRFFLTAVEAEKYGKEGLPASWMTPPTGPATTSSSQLPGGGLAGLGAPPVINGSANGAGAPPAAPQPGGQVSLLS